ncbi:ImmA/IrrE family metallo-endopeptidase [Lacticaseibacillus jixiensis]|uniref:ImmA/IrrE family metallo-endopeptidase n=1 Tax=Lacticaseibacillus jixiensis TaxID=3231926 RepID=UPI0036F387D7
MLINMNWHNQQQVPYSIAHEIGHVQNGDAGVLYSTPMKSRLESSADRFEVGLLVPIYHENIDREFVNTRRFMDSLHIPDCLENYCNEVIANFYS